MGTSFGENSGAIHSSGVRYFPQVLLEPKTELKGKRLKLNRTPNGCCSLSALCVIKQLFAELAFLFEFVNIILFKLFIISTGC